MTDILIVGSGALATLFAARLAAAEHAITLLGGWAEGLRALRENGARLVEADGRELRFPLMVASEPGQCRGARFCLVLVKSWQTGRAAAQLAQCLAQDGLAITLQNGLGNREILAQSLGAGRVALGSTSTGATLLGPGLVKAGGEGVISIETHPALGPAAQALRSAGFNVQVVQDARALVWSKLIINAAIYPLTALLRVPNGGLLERPTARALMRALAQEAAAVAAAEQVRLAPGDAADAVEAVARQTALNHSSMLQDIQRGAPTEIDAICGAVARSGAKHGIPTPLTSACWQLVQAAVEGQILSNS
jgi:2-dehydropantoate 2-reductase